MASIPLIYNLRSMKVRWTSTIVAVVAIAVVVAVFLTNLSMARGFQEALRLSGSRDNAIVLRAGSQSEMMSFMVLDQAKVIGDATGVARDQNNNPVISSEVVLNAVLPMTAKDAEATVLVRGVSDKALRVRDRVKIVEGRFIKPGLAELVVGKTAAKTYKNLRVGDSPSFSGQTWTVVGVFDAGGSSLDSEVWCDASVLNQTYQRPPFLFQSVIVKLTSSQAFSDFKDALTADPRLNVKVEREIDYYEKQSSGFNRLINSLGLVFIIVMALGAVLAALNTMYATVSARSSEIATMRALGFSGGHVVFSFVLESLAVALIGGLLGCLITLPLNGLTNSTFNFASFSQITYAFKVTPDLMLKSLIFALVMGFFGGLLPALRAARQQIAGTLRGM